MILETCPCPACGVLLQASIPSRWRSGSGDQDHPVVVVTCVRCAIRQPIPLRGKISLDRPVALREVLHRFTPTVERAAIRRRAVGIGLAEAIQIARQTAPTVMPYAASYDTDTCVCGVLEQIEGHFTHNAGGFLSGMVKPTGKWQIHIIRATTQQIEVGSLAEALLVLPFEYQIPTDTGWVPGSLALTQDKPYDLRPYRLGGGTP